jgi:hypothetical protein
MNFPKGRRPHHEIETLYRQSDEVNPHKLNKEEMRVGVWMMTKTSLRVKQRRDSGCLISCFESNAFVRSDKLRRRIISNTQNIN